MHIANCETFSEILKQRTSIHDPHYKLFCEKGVFLIFFQAWLAGDVITCALDCDNGTMTFYRFVECLSEIQL